MNLEHPVTIELPDCRDVEVCMNEARRRYHRTLAGWASDLLVLRQTDRHLLAWRKGDAEYGWWNKAA